MARVHELLATVHELLAKISTLAIEDGSLYIYHNSNTLEETMKTAHNDVPPIECHASKTWCRASLYTKNSKL